MRVLATVTVAAGVTASCAAASIFLFARRRMPEAVDHLSEFSRLLRLAEHGEHLAMVAAALCLVGFVLAWQQRARGLMLLAVAGLLINSLTLAPRVLGLLLAYALGQGGGLPR